GDTATAHASIYAITATVSDGSGLASNYAVTLSPGTLTVNKKSFTATIAGDIQTFGNPANLAADLGSTIATGVNGEDLAIAYASQGNTGTSHVGFYAITGTLSDGTGHASDYSVTLNPGTLTVNQKALTFTLASDTQTYGSPVNLAADLGTTIATGVNG